MPEGIYSNSIDGHDHDTLHLTFLTVPCPSTSSAEVRNLGRVRHEVPITSRARVGKICLRDLIREPYTMRGAVEDNCVEGERVK